MIEKCNNNSTVSMRPIVRFCNSLSFDQLYGRFLIEKLVYKLFFNLENEYLKNYFVNLFILFLNQQPNPYCLIKKNDNY